MRRAPKCLVIICLNELRYFLILLRRRVTKQKEALIRRKEHVHPAYIVTVTKFKRLND